MQFESSAQCLPLAHLSGHVPPQGTVASVAMQHLPDPGSHEPPTQTLASPQGWPSAQPLGHVHCPPRHTPLSQSAPMRHALLVPHLTEQVPPQCVSVSLQHVPLTHAPFAQLESRTQLPPSGHFGHVPPHGTEASVGVQQFPDTGLHPPPTQTLASPQGSPSVQALGQVHCPVRHTPLWQSVPIKHALLLPHWTGQVPPQCVSVSLQHVPMTQAPLVQLESNTQLWPSAHFAVQLPPQRPAVSVGIQQDPASQIPPPHSPSVVHAMTTRGTANTTRAPASAALRQMPSAKRHARNPARSATVILVGHVL